ncbi:Hypothetical protein PHPALM_243 [Phytophthora palmivora]|uniref:Gag protein n=1 Tax=Phytophthora palmivora TaxID=4796 RepID=A0A2P4YVB6_9STRA|nr:Hypothetical protein PHPALM_243 [Phytophthora palmivora]
MSITSARASLPVNKGSVSCMRDASTRCISGEEPLPEHIKVAVFMDGLKVGPSRTQLFRVHANTMEEAIQIALQEEYSHRLAHTPTSVWQGHNSSNESLHRSGTHGTGAPSAVTDVGSSGTCNVPALREGKGSSLPNLGGRGARGKEPGELGSPVGAGRPTGEDLSSHGRSADGARHGGLAPESLGALETRKSSGGLLVVHVSVRGYGDPFRVLIDSGASTNFARRQTVARNGDKYADALRESEGRSQVSVRLAGGTVVNVPGVRMDLAVKFEDFDSTGSLDMDKYDLILGMPWLEKHEPWIDWLGKAIAASRPAISDRALVSNVPTSVRDWCQRLSPRRLRVQRIPQTAEAVKEDAKSASGVGNIVPRKVEETEKIESTACVSSMGNEVPRRVKTTSTRAEVSLSTSRVDNKVPHSESETPQARPVEEQYHVFDGVSGYQSRVIHLVAQSEVSALLNLEEMFMAWPS